jgi:hypothetical protein
LRCTKNLLQEAKQVPFGPKLRENDGLLTKSQGTRN